MTTLKRDELAVQFASNDILNKITRDHIRYFKAGWDACVREMQAERDSLRQEIAALRKYFELTICVESGEAIEAINEADRIAKEREK